MYSGDTQLKGINETARSMPPSYRCARKSKRVVKKIKTHSKTTDTDEICVLEANSALGKQLWPVPGYGLP